MEVNEEMDEIIHLRKYGARNKSIACTKLSSIIKPSSQSSRKSLDQRSKMLKTFLQCIYSLNNSCTNMSECSVTLAYFLKQNIQLAQDTLEKAGYSAFVKLDVKSVLELKLLLTLSLLAKNVKCSADQICILANFVLDTII